MKKWIVSYRYRGSDNRFMSPFKIAVYANSKKDARFEAFNLIGDIYLIVNVKEA